MLQRCFSKRWFERQIDKVMATKGSSLVQPKHCRDFCEQLAQQMSNHNLTQVRYVEEYDVFTDCVKEDEWSKFFSEKKVSSDKNEKHTQTRIEACKCSPLRKVGENQYAFIHTSLYEYFVSDVMYKEAISKKPVKQALGTQGQFFQSAPKETPVTFSQPPAPAKSVSSPPDASKPVVEPPSKGAHLPASRLEDEKSKPWSSLKRTQ